MRLFVGFTLGGGGGGGAGGWWWVHMDQHLCQGITKTKTCIREYATII